MDQLNMTSQVSNITRKINKQKSVKTENKEHTIALVYRTKRTYI